MVRDFGGEGSRGDTTVVENSQHATRGVHENLMVSAMEPNTKFAGRSHTNNNMANPTLSNADIQLGAARNRETPPRIALPGWV